MKLSIIVPVYNVKPFLPACIDSLVGQTIDDFEIILIDDGSTDGSAAIIEEYKQRYPKIIQSMRVDNGGQGRARNFAIDMARGEYMGFVDSDDWVSPDMYEKMYNKAKADNADIVICDFIEKFSDGRENYLCAAVQDEVLASAGSACNKIFRSSLIENVRFPEGLWYEDFYFSAVMLLKSRRTVFIPEAFYFYRRGQESTMHNNNARKNLDIITIMDMLGDFMLPRDMKDDFDFLLINHVAIDSINRLASQLTPDEDAISQLRSYIKKYLPKLSSSSAFKKESVKRRIVCWLNSNGLHKVSQKLLGIKDSAKKILKA